MEEQTDKAFIKNISIVIVLLVVFTFFIVFVARDIGFKEDVGGNPSRDESTAERIRPVADVYTEDSGIPATPVAASTPAAADAASGEIDGQAVYNSVCMACHSTGAAGAPIPGTELMAQRAEKGLDGLVQNAVNGLNAMPAKGGRPDLSDEEIRAAVEFMLQ